MVKFNLKVSTLIAWCLVFTAQADTLFVTGNPASPPFLESELQRRGWSGQVTSLQPGQQQALADGHRLVNRPLPELPAAVLLFSDHPEKVKERGLLYSAGLVRMKPVRFQYYHLGQMPSPAVLSLRLFNPGPQTARIHAILAAGGPSGDYFRAGHTNNTHFLPRLARFEGSEFEVPPGQWVEIDSHALPDGKVVSGTAQMTLVEGPPLQFGLFAQAYPEEPIALTLLSDPADVHARGVYPVADQTVRRSYKLGNPPQNVAFGAVHQANIWEEKELRGDYGVVYTMELSIHNPHSVARPLLIEFNPRGGAATGTFWVKGELLEIPVTKAYAKVKLGQWMIPPGTHRLDLLTLPEGASSYPVRLILSAPSAELKGSLQESGKSSKSLTFGRERSGSREPI